MVRFRDVEGETGRGRRGMDGTEGRGFAELELGVMVLGLFVCLPGREMPIWGVDLSDHFGLLVFTLEVLLDVIR